MRTTFDIDTSVLEDMKVLQKTERKPLGRLASELLSEALAARRAAARKGGEARQPTLDWASKPMRALVDIGDKEALHAVLDDGA